MRGEWSTAAESPGAAGVVAGPELPAENRNKERSSGMLIKSSHSSEMLAPFRRAGRSFSEFGERRRPAWLPHAHVLVALPFAERPNDNRRGLRFREPRGGMG